MLVIAAAGSQCPKEGKPREYITDAEPVTVPDSAYYRRLVDDGSLQEVIDAGSAEPETKKGAKANGK